MNEEQNLTNIINSEIDFPIDSISLKNTNSNEFAVRKSKLAIQQLLLWFKTIPGEITEKPNWGGVLHRYVGKLMNPQNINNLTTEITLGISENFNGIFTIKELNIYPSKEQRYTLVIDLTVKDYFTEEETNLKFETDLSDSKEN